MFYWTFPTQGTALSCWAKSYAATTSPFGRVTSGRKIAKEIDISNVTLQNKEVPCKLVLSNFQDIEKIKLQYNQFTLVFPKEDSLNYDQKCNIYEQLLLSQSKFGFLDSYKKCAIEYSTFKNKSKGHYFYHYLNKYWWNYGYSPEYIWVWSIIFILFFTIINYFIYNYLMNEVYEITFLKNNSNGFYLKPFIYTCILFFGLKMDIDHLKPIKFGTYYVFLIYIIGVFCLAYLVRFIFQ